MSTDPQKTPHASSVLEFKSSTFFVPILILSSSDLVLIEQALQEKIRLAPEFFKNSPLIIDVQAINKQGSGLDVVAITNMMRNIGLFPTGLRGGNKKQNKQARSLFIPIDTVRDNDSSVLSTLTQKKVPEPQPQEPEEVIVVETPVTVSSTSSSPSSPLPASETTTLLVTQPVRSGQRIYASGDLVVLSQVSAGAEIMAEGNIHVYNTLRGRALAGVQGDTDARIFCFDLQAELVSIAGDYKTSEDMNKTTHKKPVQIYLQDRALIIKEIA